MTDAWHVISTVDPLADSDEEGVDEGSRLEYCESASCLRPRAFRAHASASPPCFARMRPVVFVASGRSRAPPPLHTATRLEVVQGIRAHAHMLAVARRQQASYYPAPDAALASAAGPAPAPGPVALPPLDVDPRTGPQSR